METVKILRALWRLRALVLLVAAVAVVAGWLLAYRVSVPPERRSYSVGMANTSILVDTPKSQVVEVAPKGSDTLGARANVLANLMVDGEIKDAIARRAGVAPKRLVARVQSADDPGPPLNARSLSYETGAALTSDMAELPIIKVETQAPDVQQAIQLANAVVAGFGDYLNSKAAAQTISDARRLRVSPIGTAQGHEAARGPGRMMALAVTLFLFLAGCGTLLALSALSRGWRAAAASEDVDDWRLPPASEQDLGEHAGLANPLGDSDTLESQPEPGRRKRTTTLRV